MKIAINTAYNAAVDCITAEGSQKAFEELPPAVPMLSLSKSVKKLKIAREEKRSNSSL
ncbi:hypothetical protein [Methanosarcina sp.]|uniref:hypothetical protein n=1 Tax=Methanosarcina sp. TaxID=2213 RepID=UPI002ABCED90|nr:hypothetical protein [Methanosarcina sp.]MDY9926864.1 hypothetical protein [Methanosarcina sp.]